MEDLIDTTDKNNTASSAAQEATTGATVGAKSGSVDFAYRKQ